MGAVIDSPEITRPAEVPGIGSARYTGVAGNHAGSAETAGGTELTFTGANYVAGRVPIWREPEQLHELRQDLLGSDTGHSENAGPVPHAKEDLSYRSRDRSGPDFLKHFGFFLFTWESVSREKVNGSLAKENPGGFPPGSWVGL